MFVMLVVRNAAVQPRRSQKISVLSRQTDVDIDLYADGLDGASSADSKPGVTPSDGTRVLSETI